MRAYPLKFYDMLRPMVWGGHKLGQFLHKSVPSDVKIGESWEVSDYGSHPSVVRNGPYRDMSLRRLQQQLGSRLVGTLAWERYPDRFPLLVKFLDAAETLSIQVHPDDDYANLHEDGQSGKTEAWYVVDAPPGGELICGVAQNASPSRFAEAIAENRPEDLLRQVPVAAGDMIFLPAGRIHSAGKHICLYEVQQTSDLTYRLWDWGRGRELHLEKGLEAIDYQFIPDPKVKGIEVTQGENSKKYLLACPYFALELLTVKTTVQESCSGRSFHILSVLEGEGSLTYADGEESLRQGESIVLPAIMGAYHLKAAVPLRVLKSYVPDLTQDIILPLRDLAISDERICDLGGEGKSNGIRLLLGRK